MHGGGGARWSASLVVGSQEGEVPSGQVLAGRFTSCVASEPAYPINALLPTQSPAQRTIMPSRATSTPGAQSSSKQRPALCVWCSAAERKERDTARHGCTRELGPGAGRTIIVSTIIALSLGARPLLDSWTTEAWEVRV